MNIATLYTLYGRRAGAELLFETTVNGMAERYPDMTFDVLCNQEALQTFEPRHDRIRKHLVPETNNQFKKAWWMETKAGSLVDALQPDLFWTPSGANSFPGRWKAPNVVTFLDLGEYFVPGKYDWKRTIFRKRICIPRSVRRGKVFTAISGHTANALQQLFRLPERPHVVYPGFSPHAPVTLEASPTEIIRKETGHAFDRVLFTPGRTDYVGKGLDLLLDVYERMAAERPDAPPLVFTGPPGNGHDAFVRRLTQVAAHAPAHWLGRVSDACVEALYRISEVVVYPSRYEGFGFPALEAMSKGVPLLCSDAGSLPEITGQAAGVFPSGDRQALGSRLIELLDSSVLRSGLIEQGKRRAAAFTWTRTFEGMREAFEQTSA